MGRDLRLAIRTLGRAPGFTLVAFVSLALGLALAASMLVILNAYILRSMPFPAADRLYHVVYSAPGQPEPSGVTVLDWHALGDVVEIADSSISTWFHLAGGDYAREASGLSVSRSSIEAIGVRAVLGRTLQSSDFAPDADAVAIIGQALWTERFGADPAVVGRHIRVHSASLAEPAQTLRVVGVLPSGFRYARSYGRGEIEMVVPLRTTMRTYMVRLQPGTAPAAAERRITDAVRIGATTIPSGWSGVQLESVHARYVAEIRPLLVATTIAAALVLAIVFANVAVLVALRTARRARELAVRVALGAGSRDIARIVLAETALLLGAAAAAALVLATVVLRVLGPIMEERLGRAAPGGSTAIVAIDPTVAMAIVGAGLTMTVLLALIPALIPWQRRLADTLRCDGRAGADRPTVRRLRSSLIACEVAGAVALLVGCGLMIRTVLNLVGTDLGYRTAGVVRARIALPERTYPDSGAFLAFYDRLSALLAGRPDEPYALTNFIPFYPAPQQAVEADSDRSGVSAGVMAVSDGYFELLQMDMREGRTFTRLDGAGAEPVAIVSDTLAGILWPGANAVGRRIRTADAPVPGAPLAGWRTILGVARDVRQTYTDDDVRDVYVPFAQAPPRYAPIFGWTSRSADAWGADLRAAAAAIDPDVLIGSAAPMQREGDALLAAPRFLASVLTGFAGFAVFVAAIGLYGVAAYAAEQRQRELAIRLALGATPGAVARLLLTAGGAVIGIGTVAGMVAGLGVSRLLAHEIHGVSMFDGWTFAGTATLMFSVGLVATWWPARRATSANAARLLRDY